MPVRWMPDGNDCEKQSEELAGAWLSRLEVCVSWLLRSETPGEICRDFTTSKK